MKIALFGYGRMGKAVEEAARPRGHTVVARIARSDNALGAGITSERMAGAEVAIDFSVSDAVETNIERAAALGMDLVVGTTGWKPGKRIRHTVEESGIGLIHSSNFSVGVHLFLRMVRLAGRLADQVEEYDPHVVEMHHRHKRDRPSGTALRVAGILLEEVERKHHWEETAIKVGQPDPHALQIAVARTGEHPGMHAVGLDGLDDRIEIRHEARTRMGFARGAVAAAEWVRGRKGFFVMEDWLGEQFGLEGREQAAEMGEAAHTADGGAAEKTPSGDPRAGRGHGAEGSRGSVGDDEKPGGAGEPGGAGGREEA